MTAALAARGARAAFWREARTARACALLAALALGAAGACASRWRAEPLFVLLVASPLLEEAAFRAGLHEALLRGAPRVANAGTALAFALAHALLHATPWALAVALPAWAIGLAYERHRSVALCAALHTACNGAWLYAMAAG
jgi:membrane protease YdiL (CAAX protease family)